MRHCLRRLPHLLLVCLSMLACESITEQPQCVGMAASLQGSRVKADSVETTASGSMTGTRCSTEVFTYTISFDGLTSAALAVHIHGPADTNEVAGILVDLASPPGGSTGSIELGGTAGEGSGTLDLSVPITGTVSGDSLHALLRRGRVYVDVHSANHGDGELRGQLVRH